MKFAFFGTPYVARDTLAALVDAGYTPEVVVTNPDAPQGRGKNLAPCETKTWALEHEIPVLTPATLDESFLETLATYECEYAIVVAYGKILPETLINAFPRGIYNVHYSLLPAYRGASPVEHALLAGETETGVTVQRMVHELDAGDVVAQAVEPIALDDTTKTLRARLIQKGAALLIDSIPSIANGTVTLTPQNHADATYASKLKKEDGEISLDDPARENWNKYRAFAEWPGTYFFTERNGKTVRVKITDASFDDGIFTINRIIPEGKREMDFGAYFPSA